MLTWGDAALGYLSEGEARVRRIRCRASHNLGFDVGLDRRKISRRLAFRDERPVSTSSVWHSQVVRNGSPQTYVSLHRLVRTWWWHSTGRVPQTPARAAIDPSDDVLALELPDISQRISAGRCRSNGRTSQLTPPCAAHPQAGSQWLRIPVAAACALLALRQVVGLLAMIRSAAPGGRTPPGRLSRQSQLTSPGDSLLPGDAVLTVCGAMHPAGGHLHAHPSVVCLSPKWPRRTRATSLDERSPRGGQLGALCIRRWISLWITLGTT